MSARILIIHNLASVLTQAKEALAPTHHATTCTGFEEAVGLLKGDAQADTAKAPFDLILCSVHMDTDSDALTIFDFLKWVKGHSIAQNIPLLLVGFNPIDVAHKLGESIRLAGVSLGAIGYEEADPSDGDDFLEVSETYLPDGLRSRAPGKNPRRRSNNDSLKKESGKNKPSH